MGISRAIRPQRGEGCGDSDGPAVWRLRSSRANKAIIALELCFFAGSSAFWAVFALELGFGRGKGKERGRKGEGKGE